MRFDVDHEFELGELVCTKGVRERLSPVHVVEALWRHVNGDWGDLDEEDWKANDAALEHGGRLLSSYRKGDVRFWIITEHDHSKTTILLPDEY